MLNIQCYGNEIDLTLRSRHSWFFVFFSLLTGCHFPGLCLSTVEYQSEFALDQGLRSIATHTCLTFTGVIPTPPPPHPFGRSVRIACTEKSKKRDCFTPKRFCGKKNVLHHVNHFRDSRPKLEVKE